MNKKAILLLSILFLLPLPILAQATIFEINTPADVANDTYWNGTEVWSDNLSPYNPYHTFVCHDLRNCYIDDTNSGVFDDDFVKEYILGRETGYSVFNGDWSRKHIANQGQYYYFRIFNDTTEGNYDVVVQRGTTTDVFFDMELIGIWEFLTTNQTDTYHFYVNYTEVSEPSNVCYGRVRLAMNNSDVTILVLQLSATLHLPVVIYHRSQNELGIWATGDKAESGGNKNYTSFYWSYNNLTDWSDVTYDYVSNSSFGLPKYYDILIHSASRWTGIKFEYNGQYCDGNSITIIPKYPTDTYNYHSVTLPYCNEILGVNEQTDFEYDHFEREWIRKCEGVLPSAYNVSCTRECAEYETSYNQERKVCLNEQWDDFNWASPNYWCHLREPDVDDGRVVIFPENVSDANISDVEIFGYLNYAVSPVDGINQSHYSTWHIGIADYIGAPDIFAMHVEKCWTSPQVVNGTIHTLLGADFETYDYIPSPFYASGTDYVIYTYSHTPLSALTYNPLTYSIECGFLYPTPPDNITDRNMTIYVDYKNITGVNMDVCVEYEPSCDFEEPAGYSVDNDSIFCFNEYCFANLRTSALLEEEIDIWTDEIAPIISNMIQVLVSGIGISLGVPEAEAFVAGKAIIWTAVTLLIVALLALASEGHLIIPIVGAIILIMLGVLIAWYPLWVGVIVLVLTAVSFAWVMRSIIGGG